MCLYLLPLALPLPSSLPSLPSRSTCVHYHVHPPYLVPKQSQHIVQQMTMQILSLLSSLLPHTCAHAPQLRAPPLPGTSAKPAYCTADDHANTFTLCDGFVTPDIH